MTTAHELLAELLEKADYFGTSEISVCAPEIFDMKAWASRAREVVGVGDPYADILDLCARHLGPAALSVGDDLEPYVDYEKIPALVESLVLNSILTQ